MLCNSQETFGLKIIHYFTKLIYDQFLQVFHGYSVKNQLTPDW